MPPDVAVIGQSLPSVGSINNEPEINNTPSALWMLFAKSCVQPINVAVRETPLAVPVAFALRVSELAPRARMVVPPGMPAPEIGSPARSPAMFEIALTVGLPDAIVPVKISGTDMAECVAAFSKSGQKQEGSRGA
jgi:hypothetical protein